MYVYVYMYIYCWTPISSGGGHGAGERAAMAVSAGGVIEHVWSIRSESLHQFL